MLDYIVVSKEGNRNYASEHRISFEFLLEQRLRKQSLREFTGRVLESSIDRPTDHNATDLLHSQEKESFDKTIF